MRSRASRTCPRSLTSGTPTCQKAPPSVQSDSRTFMLMTFTPGC